MSIDARTLLDDIERLQRENDDLRRRNFTLREQTMALRAQLSIAHGRAANAQPPPPARGLK